MRASNATSKEDTSSQQPIFPDVKEKDNEYVRKE